MAKLCTYCEHFRLDLGVIDSEITIEPTTINCSKQHYICKSIDSSNKVLAETIEQAADCADFQWHSDIAAEFNLTNKD